MDRGNQLLAIALGVTLVSGLIWAAIGGNKGDKR